MYKNRFGIINLLWLIAINQTKPYRILSMAQIELNCTYAQTEFFEIELFKCIKIDMASRTYNSWCAIKPNKTKPNQTSQWVK